MSDELKEKPPEHVWVRHIYKCGSRYSFVASDDDMGRNFEYVRADLSRAPALAEENARLRALLAVFGQAAVLIDSKPDWPVHGKIPDSSECPYRFTMGSVRAARAASKERAALAQNRGGENG